MELVSGVSVGVSIDGQGDGTFFAFFVLAKVVTDGDGDLFDRLLSDAGDLFELFGGHVGDRFDGGDAGCDELFEDLLAELGDLLDGGLGVTGHGLHLLLDLLALLFLGLDVDLPLEELGGETDVLALLADGEGELGVIDDDFELLVGEVGDGDASDLGGLKGFLGEGGDLFGVLDDVDLLAAELADDGLDAHALHADAGADGVDVLVAGHDGDLGALTSFAGDGADADCTVVDLGNFGLEEILDEGGGGAGDDDLRALGGAVYSQKHNSYALTDGEGFEAGLLALGHAGFGLAEVEDDVHGLKALDDGVEDFTGAVVVLVEDSVAFGFTDLLKDDLLGHLGGDSAEGAGVLVEAEFTADFDLRGEGDGRVVGHLIDGVFDLLFVFDDGLEDVGADLAGVFIHLGAHVFLGLVVLARG